MKNISPKDVKDSRRNHESANAHPQPIGERRKGKRNDKVGEQRRHEHDERLCCHQVQENPHDKGKECLCAGPKVGEPVGHDGEENRD